MKRHEIIYALRAYTDHADLAAMLSWSTAALEKYLRLCQEFGKPREVLGGSIFKPMHIIIEEVGKPAQKSYKVGDAMLVKFPVDFIIKSPTA